jgi:hypothetical protein
VRTADAQIVIDPQRATSQTRIGWGTARSLLDIRPLPRQCG